MAATSATYPPPPPYYRLYKDYLQNPKSAPVPPPPIKGTYMLYGGAYTADDVLPSLEEQGIHQLYPKGPNIDFKKELRSLNRELQLHILELADVLVERPSQYARRVEDISLIFKNLHHLLNSLRPHQGNADSHTRTTDTTLKTSSGRHQKKKKGTFQHSSFLAGGATSAAGRLVVENGVLKAVWPHSGHYRPTEENFQEFMTYLKEHNVDLTDVKRSPTDEEEDSLRKQRSSIGLIRENSSEQDLTQEVTDFEAEDINSVDLIQEPTDSAKLVSDSEPEPEESMKTHNLKSKLSNLKIPKRNDLFETSVSQCLLDGPSCNSLSGETLSNGCETAEDLIMPEQDYMVPKRNLFEEDQEKKEDEIIPKESILQRINSKKGTKSYQLGKKLSCKWTTGAGPRIGCLRDYPSELQFRALEQANLSPRSDGCSRAYSSPRSLKGLSPKVSTPTSLWRETTPTIRTNLR